MDSHDERAQAGAQAPTDKPTARRDQELLARYGATQGRLGVCSGSKAQGCKEVVTTLEPPASWRKN
jgi:hypothetical protein